MEFLYLECVETFTESKKHGFNFGFPHFPPSFQQVFKPLVQAGLHTFAYTAYNKPRRLCKEAGMMKRRNRRRCKTTPAVVCIAFGAGIFLSLFCSLKLVVILAAIFLVVLGLMSMDC